MSSQVTGVSTNTPLEEAQVSTPPVMRRRNMIETWVFLIPALLLQLAWGWYPLVMGFVVSVTDGQMMRPAQFVGLYNYMFLLQHDPTVIKTLQTTVLFSTLSIVLTFLTPILVAIFIMEMPRKVIYVMMFLWFLPLSGIANIYLWKYIYNRDYGLLQYVFVNLLHLPAQRFLDDPNLVLFWLIFPGLLLYGPGILYMATLQGIPNSYFEAAEVEGAGLWRKIWTITLPRLRPIVFLSLLFAITGMLMPFDQMKLMTNGGPGGNSRSVMMYVYDLIQGGLYAQGAALSGIIFVISMALAVIFRLVFKDDPDA